MVYHRQQVPARAEGARRRWLIAASLAAALLLPLLPAAPGQAALPFPDVQRIDASQFRSTAIQISQMLFEDGAAGAVVLAREDKFPDALGASGVSAGFDGPLLYTPSDDLAVATRDEVRRVLPPGGTVYLMGGERAISKGVETELDALGYRTPRFGGLTRVETAALAARAVGAGPDDSVLVLRSHGDPDDSQGWVDSVSCGGVASDTRTPILLTNPADPELHPATRSTLEFLGIRQAIICGGPNAVPQAHADQMADMGISVERRAGLDRVETAVDVARGLWGAGTPDGRTFLLVPGWGTNYGFGLAAAMLSASLDAPMLLVGRDEPTNCSGEQPSRVTLCYLLTKNEPIAGLVAVGSPGVMSDEVVAAAALSGGLEPDTTPPPVPTGVQAEDVDEDDGTQVAVRWDAVEDPEGGPVAYAVYARVATDGTFTKANSTRVGTTRRTRATVGGLAPGTDYQFAVTSIDDWGNESRVSRVAGATPTDEIPAAPDGAPNLSNEAEGIRIGWAGAPEADAAGYVIQRATPGLLSECGGLGGEAWTDHITVDDPTVVSVVDTDVASGTTYCYRYAVFDTSEPPNRSNPSPVATITR